MILPLEKHEDVALPDGPRVGGIHKAQEILMLEKQRVAAKLKVNDTKKKASKVKDTQKIGGPGAARRAKSFSGLLGAPSDNYGKRILRDPRALGSAPAWLPGPWLSAPGSQPPREIK